jgi:hypothetical protein
MKHTVQRSMYQQLHTYTYSNIHSCIVNSSRLGTVAALLIIVFGKTVRYLLMDPNLFIDSFPLFVLYML